MVDRIDSAREDAKRVQKKQVHNRHDQNKEAQSRSFLSHYQDKLNTKQTKETRADLKKEGGQPQEEKKQLFSRIVEVLGGKEQGKEEAKKEFAKRELSKREFNKSEDEKKERFHEKSEGRTKSSAEEGHGRVASKHSSHQQGSQGEGKGSFSGGGQSGGRDHGGSFSGFSDSGKQQQSDKQAVMRYSKRGGEPVRSVKSFSVEIGSRFSGGRTFSEETLNEVVESVRLLVNEEGESELDVQLSDEYFGGLRLKASHTKEGVVLTFICPNREVRNTFLLHHPVIFSRLKEKQIAVSRIEVV